LMQLWRDRQSVRAQDSTQQGSGSRREK
jgi:hypothetical protein